MDTNTKLSLTFKGQLDASPIGFQHVFLKSTGEHFSIQRPNTVVGNLLFGTMYIEHVGKMTVTNQQTGYLCVLDFLPTGWYGVNKHVVKGDAYMSLKDKKSDNSVAKMSGTWSGKIQVEKNGKISDVWISNPAPDKNDWQYKFTKFSFILNNLPEDLKPFLPRSDSRFRTDQRALEEGKFELAAEEKHRLEEKQRAARKWRAENPGNDFQPKYFKQITDPDTKEEYWAYGVQGTRDYWQDRRNRDFAHMEDLY